MMEPKKSSSRKGDSDPIAERLGFRNDILVHVLFNLFIR